uniref:Uncharacterized protein n=1 Tax=Palpitomonas bilix TaxID=652834 RepID=A0A7S3G0M2_9EUKA
MAMEVAEDEAFLNYGVCQGISSSDEEEDDEDDDEDDDDDDDSDVEGTEKKDKEEVSGSSVNIGNVHSNEGRQIGKTDTRRNLRCGRKTKDEGKYLVMERESDDEEEEGMDIIFETAKRHRLKLFKKSDKQGCHCKTLFQPIIDEVTAPNFDGAPKVKKAGLLLKTAECSCYAGTSLKREKALLLLLRYHVEKQCWTQKVGSLKIGSTLYNWLMESTVKLNLFMYAWIEWRRRREGGETLLGKRILQEMPQQSSLQEFLKDIKRNCGDMERRRAFWHSRSIRGRVCDRPSPPTHDMFFLISIELWIPLLQYTTKGRKCDRLGFSEFSALRGAFHENSKLFLGHVLPATVYKCIHGEMAKRLHNLDRKVKKSRVESQPSRERKAPKLTGNSIFRAIAVATMKIDDVKNRKHTSF